MLKRLDIETFVLDMADQVVEPPEISGYPIRFINPTQLEVDISRQQSLNELFVNLSALDIKIISMRTKTNRLEELFVRLTSQESSNK